MAPPKVEYVADENGRQTTGERPPEIDPGATPPSGAPPLVPTEPPASPVTTQAPPSAPSPSPPSSLPPPPRETAPGPGIRLGRPFGVPLFVSPSWFLIAGFITFYFGNGMNGTEFGDQLGNWRFALSFAYAVFLYASVVIHELAHSVVALRFGYPVRRIVIHFLGGVSEIEKEAETPGREFWIAFVGPLTSAVLAGAGYLVYLAVPHGDGLGTGGKVVATLLFGFWASNLLVAIFNMLPGLPLDGGRVLRAAVWAATGKPLNGTVAAAWTGRVLAVAVFFITSWLYSDANGLNPTGVVIAGLMAAFIWFGASQSLLVGRLRARIPSLSARGLARRAVTVEARVPLAEALRRANEVGAGGLVVVDGSGRPTGVVSEAQVLATPEQRRPWLDVSTVSRSLEPGLLVDSTLTGEALLEVLRANPASEYVVVEPSGAVIGVLASTDVQAAFLGKAAGA